jgi:CRISPR-associated protein Csd2
MHGLISDVAVKRRIRNYVQLAYKNEAPYGIVIQQSSNINKFIAKAHQETGGEKKDKSREKVNAARKWMCENFFDVRTFGAVLSTGDNAGQVRGAVQLTFLRSIDSILPLDMSITRMAVTENIKDGSYEDYVKWENEHDEDKLRTMGRKQLIPFGLYEGRGFISANLAEDTEFSDEDLTLFWEALLNMYEHDRSASKGQMSTVMPVIIFKHTGTDSDEIQRQRQSRLGCAPAHKLFELVKTKRKDNVAVPRSYEDYNATIEIQSIPSGVEIGFAYMHDGKINISWGSAPKGYDWIKII